MLQAATIHEKALRDIHAMRRKRPPATLPPLRGFKGTFVTPGGRCMDAAAYCAAVERLSRMPGQDLNGTPATAPSAEAMRDPRLPEPKQLRHEKLLATRDRLCVAKEAPGALGPLRPVWLEQTWDAKTGWVDVERPWPHRSAKKQLETMRGMYDRCDATLQGLGLRCGLRFECLGSGLLPTCTGSCDTLTRQTRWGWPPEGP
jgi:hypothetical protein